MLECGVGALYDYNVVMMSLKCLFCFRFILVFDLGTIPSTIGSLTGLTYLDMGVNILTGIIYILNMVDVLFICDEFRFNC